jgi:hypothetical protein
MVSRGSYLSHSFRGNCRGGGKHGKTHHHKAAGEQAVPGKVDTGGTLGLGLLPKPRAGCGFLWQSYLGPINVWVVKPSTTLAQRRYLVAVEFVHANFDQNRLTWFSQSSSTPPPSGALNQPCEAGWFSRQNRETEARQSKSTGEHP